MYDDLYALMELEPNPYEFASTASGPLLSDIAGPPGDVLDIYGDGTPMDRAQSELYASGGKGGGGSLPGGIRGFLLRGDVHSALLLLLGAWMIKKYAEE